MTYVVFQLKLPVFVSKSCSLYNRICLLISSILHLVLVFVFFLIICSQLSHFCFQNDSHVLIQSGSFYSIGAGQKERGLVNKIVRYPVSRSVESHILHTVGVTAALVPRGFGPPRTKSVWPLLDPYPLADLVTLNEILADLVPPQKHLIT